MAFRPRVDRRRRVLHVLDEAAGRLVVVGSGAGSLGAVDRSLGVLALTAGHPDAAIEHLRRALELHQRIGALPWTARTSAPLAEALLTRDGTGDRGEAEKLLSTARATAERLAAHGLQNAIDQASPSHGSLSPSAGAS